MSRYVEAFYPSSSNRQAPAPASSKWKQRGASATGRRLSSKAGEAQSGEAGEASSSKAEASPSKAGETQLRRRLSSKAGEATSGEAGEASSSKAEVSSSKPGEMQPKMYPRYYLTRSLTGIEEGCLLMRGAQELHPSTPQAELQPMGVEDEFRRNSSLKSFWKALRRVKVPKDEFYFIRVEGKSSEERCTGLVLLKLTATPSTRNPSCMVDIKNMCSTGTGKGTLLCFKLFSYLAKLSIPTQLYVRLAKCMEESAGFYAKMGFQKATPHAAIAGDVLFVDVKEGSWRKYAHERTGGVAELLNETEDLPVSADHELLQDYWPESSSEVESSPEVRKFGPGAQHFGQRVTVCGNGTCWLYAFMASVGVCEHANPCALGGCQVENPPTDMDYKISQTILKKMQTEVRSMKLGRVAITALDNKKVATQGGPPGTYGGGADDYAILSHVFNCTIVELDLSKPDEAKIYNGNLKGKLKKYDQEQIAKLMQDAVEEEEPVVVVEFNGAHGETLAAGNPGGHYAGYKSLDACKPCVPPWLASALLKSTATK